MNFLLRKTCGSDRFAGSCPAGSVTQLTAFGLRDKNLERMSASSPPSIAVKCRQVSHLGAHTPLHGADFGSGVGWCWRTIALRCRISACPTATASLIGDGRRAFVQFSPGVSLLLGVRVDECNHVRFGHRVGNDIGYG